MTKSHPQDETTHALVNSFCEQIFWLKQVHYIGCELFNDEGTRSLMERTAPAFFQDLNKILIDYFLLEVAKLTDPSTSLGGKRENFTVANLIETVEWPSDCLQRIEQLNETVQSFRKHIKPARDRLLAHYDKTTVISGESLGAFPKGEDEKLLEALEQMCDLFHEVSFGEIFGDMKCGHSGDVRHLVESLKSAIAFDKLLSDSKRDDLARLHRLRNDVASRPA